MNNGSPASVVYSYDDLGRVSQRTLGNGIVETQEYNIQGWLTQVSAQKGSANIYNQTLRYYNPAKGTAALYSGNISEWSSQQASLQQETYGFTYDLQGRLTQSNRYSGTGTYAQNAYTERGITYDRNGNILTLQRYAAALQDNYTYTYNGNKVTFISGTNNGTAISAATYSYDNNGNTVQDGLKNLQITYNILNLPQTVTQSGTTKATYGWFADGSKYSVQDAQGNGYCYIGSLIYSTTAGAAVLESTDFAEGRITVAGTTQTIHYHHKDHLGSVRAVTDTNSTVIEQNAYYPFGGRHNFGQTYAQTSANRYKFNGKELQTTGNLGLLDYGARMYDTKIARWLAQDPLAEKYYPFSAYNYCVNNPVMFVDLDGRDTINVVFNDKTQMWEYSTPILSEGDDVFVINGKNVIFSEGEYMNRVLLLNLEISDGFTLGLYYVSGSKDAVGFFIAPGGDASKIVGSGKRIPDGTYPMTTPGEWGEWRVPGVGGDVIERGIRFHFGRNVGSTSGCFILCSDYELGDGGPYFNPVNSKNSSKRFYEALGEVESYKYISPKGKQRTGTRYKSSLSHKVTLKSFLK